MKQEQDHIKIYSAREIQEYLEGRMSAREMHALEKAALDDPFLADAIEGYAVGNKEQQNKDLQSVRLQLEKRIHNGKKKKWLVPVWMKAAIIILAVSAGGLTIYHLFTANTEGKESPLAKNEKLGPVNTDANTANAQPKADTPAIVQTETNLSKTDDTKSESKKTAGVKQGKAELPSATVADKIQTSPAAPLRDQSENALAGVASNAEVEKKEQGRAAEQEPTTLNAFSGKVLDSKNKPVAGATIMAKNRKASAVTDMNGQFNISAPDTTLNIEVSSLGFEKHNAVLKNNNSVSNNIILHEAESPLEEVVVVGYGVSKDKKAMRAQKLDSAKLKDKEVEPIGGWDEYNSYINSNKRTPAGQDEIDGEVILSFDVNEDNKLSNIKIEKSLSRELDEEAIRLVKEGPQWKPRKGKNAKGKLAIKF